MERGKYNLIYEYYKCHILFGHLRKGEFLPTIEQIGGTFQVAPQTVRNALRKLQQDHLIDVSPGRHTLVVHETTPEETLQVTRQYYLARKEAIGTVYQVTDLLLTPVFRAGAQKLTDYELHEILRVCRQKNAGIVSISMFCCNRMLNAVQNQLIRSLFADMVSFFQFPYITSFDEETSEEYQECHRNLIASCEALDRGGVFRAFMGLQSITQQVLQGFIDDTSQTAAVPDQISFHWQTYRDRPQHCHTLAARIIYGLIKGKYAEGEMLPSYENMALEFAVSVNTVRRTVGLLRDMGLIHSINGVGNQVQFSAPNWEKLRRPSIQKNVLMAKESIELLLLTAEEIISRDLLRLDETRTRDLKNLLADSKGLCGLEAIVLVTEYILVLHPVTAFFETYGKLLEFLLFTYPFLSEQQSTMGAGPSAPIEKLTRAIDAEDSDLFAQGYMELLREVGAKIEHTANFLQKRS